MLDDNVGMTLTVTTCNYIDSYSTIHLMHSFHQKIEEKKNNTHKNSFNV